MSELDYQVQREAERRRTFAVISHPDAGKTTLTVKLLLFGGCIDVAGAARGHKPQRAATSDWLELEKQHGISVSSTVLTFEFEGHQINLLDTPGHHDFSEDTYRTLMAADCAVMVIDLAKGIESQTEKLFRVCALRQIPVITFVNKVNRPGLSPLAILEEIETKFGIDAIPHNWPVGTGPDFSDVVEVESGMAHLFTTRDANRRIAHRTVDVADLTLLCYFSPSGMPSPRSGKPQGLVSRLCACPNHRAMASGIRVSRGDGFARVRAAAARRWQGCRVWHFDNKMTGRKRVSD